MSTAIAPKFTPEELAQKWETLLTTQGNMRIRNAADALGVSEVELLATKCGDTVTRLKPDFKNILTDVIKLEKVMALSRNEEVVHERKGEYLNPGFDSPFVGLFVGEDIDLRIFINRWASAYAVSEPIANKENSFRKSLQFFGKDGEAIHKIYLTAHSNEAAFDELVNAYKADDQNKGQEVFEKEMERPSAKDEDVDVDTFRQAWINLKDTHDFFGLLKMHNLSRTQALRLAPEGHYAVKAKNSTLRDIISLASEREIPVMVFVGNQGIIQIHTGYVKRLLDHEQWFNVMDPDFNLHINEPKIAETWIVRKPTVDGVVTALECFNEKGEQIVQLFGKRKPGLPELEEWRSLVAEVERNLN